MDTKKWCSGLEQLGDGQTRCKHGHAGPGMQACKGIRYPHGTSLAPCEREDLPFCETRKCVRADMRPNVPVRRPQERAPAGGDEPEAARSCGSSRPAG